MTDVFDQTLQASADSFFLLPGMECITYFPASGASRQIKAVVQRIEAAQIDDLSGGSREPVQFLVKNDSVDGISSDEVNTGGDKVEIAMRTANMPVILRIVEIVNQDAGMLELKAI